MKRREEVPQAKTLLSSFVLAAAELAGPCRVLPQYLGRGFVRLRRVPWQLALLCLGLVVQAGLVWMVWRLVELCISLLEAWTLLARYTVGAV